MNRTASVEEMDELFDYFGKSQEDELKQLVDHTFDTLEENTALPSNAEHNALSRLDTHIHSHIRSSIDDTTPIVRMRFPVRWAVAIVIFIAAGWAISRWRLLPSPPEGTPTSIAHTPDSAPGRAQATLTLEDGRTIELKETEEGIMVVGDQVRYNDGQDVAEGVAVSQLSTISTPRGGQYRITLSDGTKVWLNAASSLRYPGSFLSKERLVELNGEGYFEVAKNPNKPFKVISRGQVTQVLGTHFNINSYPDESSVKTTLLEGSVKVASLDTDQSVTLVPGKQSVLTTKGLQVHDVDMEATIAWKNDDFIFRGQDLKTTMRQLARWYDVEIAYANNAPFHLKIGGSVSRKNSLSSVLRAMESTNSVKFEFDGKTILVK